LLHCEARRPARRVNGRFVPLEEQDPGNWDASLIQQAESELQAAAQQMQLGRFQLEAAIQSVHAERKHTARTDWHAICAFYDRLMQLAPSLGAQVARAAAHAEAYGPGAALTMLDALDTQAIRSYQPYWAVRAHVLQQLQNSAATAAYDQAIGLTEDPALREFLLERRAAITLARS
jgi:predicted RNA polymerase sigma factor